MIEEENPDHNSIKFWRDKCHYYEVLYKKYKDIFTKHRVIMRAHMHTLRDVEIATRKELKELYVDANEQITGEVEES